MKIGAIICSVIAVLWVILALVQLWLTPLSYEMFIKISVSAGLIFVIVLVIALVIREYISDKKLKGGGYIDD